MPQPIQMRIAHQIDGRTRLSALQPVSAQALAAYGQRLAEQGNVQVETRPGSASLVITHAQPWAKLGPALEEAGVELSVATPRTPVQVVSNALRSANKGVGRATGGNIDLVNIGFIILLLAGLRQMYRGNTFGPATTLFSQALTLALLHNRS